MVVQSGEDAHRLFRDEGEGVGVEDGAQDSLQRGGLGKDAVGVAQIEDGLDVGNALTEEAKETGLFWDDEPALAEIKAVYGCLDAGWAGSAR